MNKLTKAMAILLTVAMVFSMSACGGNKPASTPGSAAPSGSDSSAQPAQPAGPASLSIMMTGDNTPPDTNSVLQAIEQATNTKLAVTYVPAKDSAAKLSTLIAAKQLPDLFRVTTVADAEDLRANGMLTDLSPYLDKYPNIQENLGDVLANHPLNKDGKVYALFHANTFYSQNMNIRTDWLEKLGLEMPTDLDSLYTVLKAFKEQDPDGNGVADTLGLGASIAKWNNFTSILGAYDIPSADGGLRPITTADGTVTTALKHPNFLEAAKYFNKLYAEGIMDPDFAAIPQMDSFGKLWNGKVGVYDFQCTGPTNNWMPGRYVENPPPTFGFAEIKGPNGKAAQAKGYLQVTPSILVSANCKDPEAALRLIDFLLSEEGGVLITYGVEGKHFEWVDKANYKYKMLAPYDDSATNRNDGVFVYSDFIRPKVTAEVRALNEQTRQGVDAAKKLSTIEWPYIYTPFDAEIMYGENLRTVEKEVFCQLVSASGDLDKIYKDGLARWDSEGGLDWEKGATEAYNSQK